MAAAMAITAAAARALMPDMFRMVTTTRPTWPHIAPSTMPKFMPRPQVAGMMRERTRKEFRATRVNSSPATKTMDCFEAIMAPMLRNTKMRTTFCSKSQVFVLAK